MMILNEFIKETDKNQMIKELLKLTEPKVISKLSVYAEPDGSK